MSTDERMKLADRDETDQEMIDRLQANWDRHGEKIGRPLKMLVNCLEPLDPIHLTGIDRDLIVYALSSARRAPEAADAGAVAWQVEWDEGGEHVRQFYPNEEAARLVKWNVESYINKRENVIVTPLYASPTAAGIAAPPAASAAEEETRKDERDRMALTLAIALLPEHEKIYDRLVRDIDCLPLLPTPDPLRAALTAPVAGADAGVQATEHIFDGMDIAAQDLADRIQDGMHREEAKGRIMAFGAGMILKGLSHNAALSQRPNTGGEDELKGAARYGNARFQP
jgi:hypothetical protein